MTVKFLDANGGVSGTSAVSTSLHNPPNIADLILAIVFQNTNGAGSIPNFTASASKAVGTSSARATFLKLAAASGQTASLAASGAAAPTAMQIAAGAFSGVTATEDATMVTAATPGAGTSLATGNITTTTEGCLLVTWLATQATAGTITIDNGFTILPFNTLRTALAFKRLGPTETGSFGATWGWGASTNGGAGIAAFRPAAVPPADLLSA